MQTFSLGQNLDNSISDEIAQKFFRQIDESRAHNRLCTCNLLSSVQHFVVQNVEQSSADRFAKYSFGFTLNTYIFHI